ncbi:MAG: 1-(5-phosphoribosyl)-5-[(5-phosphoribosylamino)methylideneamino] imidazole-4-carboxamide isomerase [Acidobacteria bacterium]|nr:1-(5-phosphoribosyl)-5-[(5-phosphoribosylamino)methylideneamino] imidazole-4-carboxamide isomerase [Acidobacteriota bacterium]
MLIPSIDLRDGQVVQLVQGKRLALATDDWQGWVERFRPFPKVQLIDLDAAMERGANEALMATICAARACRVGGGIRSIARARLVLDLGATHVIVSSALFRDGQIDLEFAASLAEAIGRERIIAAVDSSAGVVTIRGWQERTRVTAAEAARALEPYCDEFLYTNVDTEGLMQGIPIDAVRAVRAATSRTVVAAGGITTYEDIAALEAIGVDAVVGMAIYTGRLALTPPGA